MEKKMILAVAFGAAMVLCLGASTVSAQALECPAHSHVEREITACGPTVTCDEMCVCDRGYHPRNAGQPVSDANPCVRDARDWGSYSDPLCAAGAVRNARGECECPTALAPRIHRHITIVTREGAELIRDQIEDYDRLRSRGRTVALMVCTDPLASAGAPGSPQRVVTDAYAQGLRILCAAPETATDEELLELCTETRALIDSIEERTTIHYGDRDYTFQDFVTEILVPKFGEIEERLSGLEAWRTERVDPTLDDHEERITALEGRPNSGPRLADGSNSFTLSVGAFGLVGFHTAGPMTGAGGLSLGLHFRPDTAPLDIYARAQLGWQATGYNVGDTPYVAAAAGVSIYLGETRRDTMLMLGLWGENLWDPAADAPDELQADSLGWAFGGEAAVSIPLHPYVRLVPGVGIGYGERRFIHNGAMVVLDGAVISPFVRLEGLLPSF